MLWLRSRRPPEPPDWQERVRDAEGRVAGWARGMLKLAPGEELFEPKWAAHDVKVAFSTRQCGKCGYCEMSVLADADGGDIDHRRPKAAVHELHDDPATWGDETPGHNSRDPDKRRVTCVISSRGYWWLAYKWHNYVLTCGVCNRKWKLSLFPIEGGHRGAPTKRSTANERTLLLDPYGDEDPVKHLEFDRTGIVVPRGDSTTGWETIRTCHLGRESLRAAREDVARLAWPRITRVIEELGRKRGDNRRLRRALRDLLVLGHRRKPHAGMVRIMWAQRDPWGLSWEKLRSLRAALQQGIGSSHGSLG